MEQPAGDDIEPLLSKDEEAGEYEEYGSTDDDKIDHGDVKWKHEHERHRSAVHMNEFRDIPNIPFLELPIQNMLQITTPAKVQNTVGSVLCNIILAQVLIAGWTFTFFEKSGVNTKSKYYSEKLETMSCLFTIASFFTMLLSIFLNIILYSESAKWTRQTDIKWFLLRYRWWFLVPTNLAFVGIWFMMTSLCCVVYMTHGRNLCIAAITGAVGSVVGAMSFYGWLVLSAKHHITDTIMSMREALKLFQMVDRDNSGTIDSAELKEALRDPAVYRDLGVPVDKIHLAFAQISNGGDSITWHQFVDYFAPQESSASRISRTEDSDQQGNNQGKRNFLAAAGFMR